MRFSIPTPTTSAVAIGPFTIHFYAICIITGVAVALVLGNRLFLQNYPDAHGVVSDVAIFAIPAGVIGGRLYHVLTTPEKYFGSHGHLIDSVKIWNGGLGIWGAIALGTAVSYRVYRHLSESRALPPFLAFADALAPGVIFAQAIGRWGNWFNGELFGKPSNLPWALEIPQNLRPLGYERFSTFHPTFLYESLWCIAVGFLLLAISSSLPTGATFTLYVALYSAGRFFIEGLRIDPAHTLGALRLNQYVALFLSLAGFLAFTRIFKRTR